MIGQMERITQAHFTKTKNMEEEYIDGLMENIMKENSKMVSNMEEEPCISKVIPKENLVFGTKVKE